MSNSRFNPVTVNGHNGYEVVSALQKSIRRGELDNACYWAADMDLSGMTQWLWNRLLIIVSEDIGAAWPEGPATVRALYQTWKDVKGKPNNAGYLFIVDAIIRMCRAPKTRLADHLAFVHWVSHEQLRREVSDESLDMHTSRGRKMGRGIDHFLDEGSKVQPEAEDPDAPVYKELERSLFHSGRTNPSVPRKTTRSEQERLELEGE